MKPKKQLLDLQKILRKPYRKVASEKALRDIEKIPWSEEVLLGKRKVSVKISDGVHPKRR